MKAVGCEFRLEFSKGWRKLSRKLAVYQKTPSSGGTLNPFGFSLLVSPCPFPKNGSEEGGPGCLKLCWGAGSATERVKSFCDASALGFDPVSAAQTEHPGWVGSSESTRRDFSLPHPSALCCAFPWSGAVCQAQLEASKDLCEHSWQLPKYHLSH